MTSPTDELIQRAEALAEEKIAGAVETIRDALVHVHSRDEGAYRDAALALSVLSSSGRELVPELVRALKESEAAAKYEARRGADQMTRRLKAEHALASANRRNSGTIEACAKIAENTPARFTSGYGYSEGRGDAAHEIAHTIRALLSNPVAVQETKE